MTEVEPSRTGDGTRVSERRAQILDAAATVFAQKGFHRARTRDIAAAAGVAEGTIFNYFPSKRDLLFALIERLVTASMPSIVAQAESMPIAELIETLAADRLGLIDRNRSLLQAIAPELFSDAELRDAFLQRVIVPMLAWIVPTVRMVIARHSGDFQPRVLLPAFMGGVIGAFLANNYEGLPLGPQVSHEEIARQLARLYTRGLQPATEEAHAHDTNVVSLPETVTSLPEEVS